MGVQLLAVVIKASFFTRDESYHEWNEEMC